jgi:hypothetical protein
MKRNRVAVGHLTTAHSFLIRVCRDEKCLAEVRPKMIEKLQNCARDWHDAVASTSKRDKVRAATIKMREHSIANEADLANSARVKLEQLRATKIGEFDPQVFINERSSIKEIEQAIRVCTDMLGDAVSDVCLRVNAMHSQVSNPDAVACPAL